MGGERAEPGGADAALWMLPDRALWCSRTRTLWVADVHLGKDQAFRQQGLAVPQGDALHDLQRLSTLMESLQAEHLCVLGDFFHHRAAHADVQLQEALRHWRARHAGVRMTLVQGNHDRHAGPPAPVLQIQTHVEPWREGTRLGWHHPPVSSSFTSDAEPDHSGPRPGPLWHLAGHLHPVVRLRLGREQLRLPCFSLHALGTDRLLVLPAFGVWTGGDLRRPAHPLAVYACTPERVWAVPAAA